MATIPTQIRIDKNLKEEANILFSKLGLDMSSAINIFLRQCILREGIPFSVEIPKYNRETINAIIEAKNISKDNSVESYSNIKDLIKALED